MKVTKRVQAEGNARTLAKLFRQSQADKEAAKARELEERARAERERRDQAKSEEIARRKHREEEKEAARQREATNSAYVMNALTRPRDRTSSTPDPAPAPEIDGAGAPLGKEEAMLMEALKASPDGLTRSQIRRQVFSDNKPSHAVQGWLDSLLRRGLVEFTTVATTGRHAERWSVLSSE